MKEEFLHFIFRNRLWDKSYMQLIDGRNIEILEIGQYNLDSGPDFLNAKIKIDNTIWVGNVELHINSADWFQHKHHEDLAYSNVILHVVFNHNKPVFINNTEELPVWEMRYPHVLFNKYSELKNNESKIPCEKYIEIVDPLKIRIWIEKLGVERLRCKSEYIEKYLKKSNNNWEYAFYISLCKSFGGTLNSFSFEELAKEIPINLVRKYQDQPKKLEALFFGQSGLFENAIIDNYLLELKKEYQYLHKLHNLGFMSRKNWKFSKLRPPNLPYMKIAQLVSVLSNFQGLFSSVISNLTYKEIRAFFNVEVSNYWKTHYVFGKIVKKTNSGFGKLSFDTLVINAISPFVFLYHKNKSNGDSVNLYYDLIKSVQAEDNRDIRIWKSLGFIPSDAFESQALLHLKRNYCDCKKCLNCQIGHSIMQQISRL